MIVSIDSFSSCHRSMNSDHYLLIVSREGLGEVKSYMSGDCRDGIVYEHFLSRLTAL